jgi:type II secretory pathway pseudopilin PulG
MLVRFEQADKRTAANAFTLVEVLIAFCVFGMVTAGMIYGYVEANRISEWSSQSLAAMSYASQGMERMRAVQWEAAQGNIQTNGPGTLDLLPMTVDTNTGLLTYSTYEVDTLDIPTTGAPIPVTNYLIVKQIQDSPPLRQIISRVVWTFSLTGQPFTNTIVTLRAPDQFQ